MWTIIKVEKKKGLKYFMDDRFDLGFTNQDYRLTLRGLIVKIKRRVLRLNFITP